MSLQIAKFTNNISYNTHEREIQINENITSLNVQRFSNYMVMSNCRFNSRNVSCALHYMFS
jgi:hypothetical protein